MPRILLSTYITAPAERVFNLSRSISLHTQSMQHTKERAVQGKRSGLMNTGDTVTWEATHLLKTRYLTVTIPKKEPYSFFVDEMVKGDFKKMKHCHFFAQTGGATVMKDDFYFQSPFGMIGRIVNVLFLTRYMKQLLQTRNRIIKQYAETEQWKTILHES